MKTQYVSIVCLFILASLVACDSSLISKRATGLPYEVVVVMSDVAWKGEAGKLVQEELNTSVPSLPQEEPSMRVTYVPPSTFNGLLKYVRNILIVDIDASVYTKVSLNYEKDRWASGQEVVKLNAPSSDALIEFLASGENSIVKYFEKKEIDRRVVLLGKSYSTLVMTKVQEKFDLSIHAPEDMKYFKDTTNFLWFSNNANTGRVDMLVYSFPYTDLKTFTQEYLVAARDSVLKRNLPGAFPDSYMATETSCSLSYEPITLNNHYCGVLRGLWKMVGDKMGGPFVSHIFLDEKNQRVIVTEGLVYAPETKKRNLIRKVEAALYTFKFM